MSAGLSVPCWPPATSFRSRAEPKSASQPDGFQRQFVPGNPSPPRPHPEGDGRGVISWGPGAIDAAKPEPWARLRTPAPDPIAGCGLPSRARRHQGGGRRPLDSAQKRGGEAEASPPPFSDFRQTGLRSPGSDRRRSSDPWRRTAAGRCCCYPWCRPSRTAADRYPAGC